VRLQLWDTAGQEKFRSLIPGYIRDSQVALIVYDITNRTSFVNVQRWYEDVKNERGNDVLIVLVGNKIDLQNRLVSVEDGERKAKEMDVLFCEVSAKVGTNVNNMFYSISANLPGAAITPKLTPKNVKLEESRVEHPLNSDDDLKMIPKRKCC